jgi:hypothetical protein
MWRADPRRASLIRLNDAAVFVQPVQDHAHFPFFFGKLACQTVSSKRVVVGSTA